MTVNWTELLDQLKLKKTNTRIAILDFLSSQSQPSTVEQIADKLSQNGIKTDLATIYRNLKTFHKCKIIKQLDLQEGKARYELSSHHHHHLVCQQCGKIVPVFDCGMEQLEKKLAKQNNYIIKYHSLEFFGLCPNCR